MDGAVVQAKTNKDDWKVLGNAKGDLTEMKIPSVRGNWHKFRITGKAPDCVSALSGIELPKITLIGYGS
jgi:hypothetical protein